MQETAWLAQRFEDNRGHLKALAQRMLGSPSEAEDAVQEAWLRLARSSAGDIANLGGWLTTVVSRICLDMLRARKSLPQSSQDAEEPEADGPGGTGPEEEMLLADSMGPALTLVLDTLAPAERVAFVLHDIFAVPFEEIASVLGRSPEAARQLASRGRRRLQGRGESDPDVDKARRQRIVDAFLSASRHGDFQALLAALHPDAILRADAMAVQVAAARQAAGAPLLAPEVRGAKAVAEAFKGRASGARRALIDGSPGAVWTQQGRVRSAFVFDIRGEIIHSIDLVMEPERLGALGVEMLPGA